MNLLSLLKRVLPFFAGLAIGLIPSWIFTTPYTEEVEVAQPTFVKSGSYCDKRSKFRNKVASERVEGGKLQILSKPRPSYTEAARSENIEGTVILRVTFLASGKIGAVTPVKRLPNGLTDEAIEAAKQIEFEPAVENGRPVSVTKQVEYTFSIY